ncbi:MAG: DUF711 family protein [Anaerolineales bacterium]|nr:DUF711 family protein [Anaerolineales bacterium]
MKIRSVTYFENPGDPVQADRISRSAKFALEAKKIFEFTEYQVQTIRFASPPFPLFISSLEAGHVVTYAKEIEQSLTAIGFDYFSLGPAIPSHPDSYSIIPDIIQSTDNTFCSGVMTDPQKGISLKSVHACGEIIHQLAPIEPNGFANLYFAALGNVPPGAPFFPAAYHGAENPRFAIAVEAADLAVKAFEGAESFEEARSNLIDLLEDHAQKLTLVSRDLEQLTSAVFGGIDYSLAPFPEEKLSIGTALESLGVERLGNFGSLTAAAFLADTIDRADFPRAGFSGLMLPLLEDAVLAKRAAEGLLGIKDFLLYSTVCGTGLDTIPLPGDLTADQLTAVLFDLAALSVRLDKPLTARLMPIPGKQAGDPTTFDFPYFANSKIVDVQGEGLISLFSGDGYLDLKPRNNRS